MPDAQQEPHSLGHRSTFHLHFINPAEVSGKSSCRSDVPRSRNNAQLTGALPGQKLRRIMHFATWGSGILQSPLGMPTGYHPAPPIAAMLRSTVVTPTLPPVTESPKIPQSSALRLAHHTPHRTHKVSLPHQTASGVAVDGLPTSLAGPPRCFLNALLRCSVCSRCQSARRERSERTVSFRSGSCVGAPTYINC